jgi:hypothetical protein
MKLLFIDGRRQLVPKSAAICSCTRSDASRQAQCHSRAGREGGRAVSPRRYGCEVNGDEVVLPVKNKVGICSWRSLGISSNSAEDQVSSYSRSSMARRAHALGREM